MDTADYQVKVAPLLVSSDLLPRDLFPNAFPRLWFGKGSSYVHTYLMWWCT